MPKVIRYAEFKSKYPNLDRCLREIFADKIGPFMEAQEAALEYVKRLREIGIHDLPPGPLADLSKALSGDEDLAFTQYHFDPQIPTDLPKIEQDHAACSEMLTYLRESDIDIETKSFVDSMQELLRFGAAEELAIELEVDFRSTEEFRDLLRRCCEVVLGREPRCWDD